MTPETIFSIVSGVAAIGWLILAVLPARKWAVDVATLGLPVFFAVTYAAILVTQLPGSAGDFSSLAAVSTLFGNPWLLLAGWIHYLAFDLFVGGWEIRDSRRLGIPHWLMLPCLLLTFLFGPAGWLLYLALRTARRFGESTVKAES
jgi:ABA4-like protein